MSEKMVMGLMNFLKETIDTNELPDSKLNRVSKLDVETGVVEGKGKYWKLISKAYDYFNDTQPSYVPVAEDIVDYVAEQLEDLGLTVTEEDIAVIAEEVAGELEERRKALEESPEFWNQMSDEDFAVKLSAMSLDSLKGLTDMVTGGKLDLVQDAIKASLPLKQRATEDVDAEDVDAESVERYAKNNNLEIVFPVGHRGYDRIFYSSLDGKYYDRYTDLNLAEEELDKWGLGAHKKAAEAKIEEQDFTVVARGMADEIEAKALATKKQGQVLPDPDDEKKWMVIVKEAKDGAWMQKAFKGAKGQLHKALKVPEGETIPVEKMKAAYHSKDPKIKKMAIAAINANPDVYASIKKEMAKENQIAERKVLEAWITKFRESCKDSKLTDESLERIFVLAEKASVAKYLKKQKKMTEKQEKFVAELEAVKLPDTIRDAVKYAMRFMQFRDAS